MSLQYMDPYGKSYVRGWGEPDFTDEEKRKYQIGKYNPNSDNYVGSEGSQYLGNRQRQNKMNVKDGFQFLKEFIFGKGEPTEPVPGMPPFPEDIFNPTGEQAGEKLESIKDAEKTTTQKVEEFLDPTGDLAEKKLDNVKGAETGAKTMNINKRIF